MEKIQTSVSRGLPRGKILTSILKRRFFHENQNAIICIIGRTGSGKSYMSLAVCEKHYRDNLHRDFPIGYCCFSPLEVVQLLKSGVLQRGDVVILEEAGVNLGSMDFAQKKVKSFNYILQTFRQMNVGLVLNLPAFSMLAKQTRQLAHIILEMEGVDKSKKISTAKMYWIKNPKFQGKIYFKRPVAVIGGVMQKISTISYDKPSDDLIERYEVKKSDFVKKTIESANKLLEDDEKDTLSPMNYDRLLSPREIYICKELLKGRRKGDIAQELEMPLSSINILKRDVARKKIKWHYFLDGWEKMTQEEIYEKTKHL